MIAIIEQQFDGTEDKEYVEATRGWWVVATDQGGNDPVLGPFDTKEEAEEAVARSEGDPE